LVEMTVGLKTLESCLSVLTKKYVVLTGPMKIGYAFVQLFHLISLTVSQYFVEKESGERGVIVSPTHI